MKELKFFLYTLYIAGYTSLVWATYFFDEVPDGLVVVFTVLNIVAGLGYLIMNWGDN